MSKLPDPVINEVAKNIADLNTADVENCLKRGPTEQSIEQCTAIFFNSKDNRLKTQTSAIFSCIERPYHLGGMKTTAMLVNFSRVTLYHQAYKTKGRDAMRANCRPHIDNLKTPGAVHATFHLQHKLLHLCGMKMCWKAFATKLRTR